MTDDLARVLGRHFRRDGDHPLIRELYRPDRWRWIEHDGRTSANKTKAEVLLVNEPTGESLFERREVAHD